MTNILSIDWDYFVAPQTDEQLYYFPDGHDFEEELSSFIWSSYYANEKVCNVLKSIIIDNDELEFMRTISTAVFPNKSMIVNSHKEIYNFIKNNVDDNNINLVNIDFHHDLFGLTDGLDCGNWLKYIMNEYKGIFTWVHRENSGFIEEAEEHGVNITTDLHCIDSILEDLNYIFVCKSNIWSPPHFDIQFKYCFEGFLRNSAQCWYQDGIFNNRYEKMMNAIEQLKPFYNQEMLVI